MSSTLLVMYHVALMIRSPSDLHLYRDYKDLAGTAAGWKRMALLISYFSPEHLRDPVTFPRIGGRLIVMPVIQTLCFAKCPGPTRRWIDAITQDWDFSRVISAHFSSPVDAGPEDVR